MKVYLAYVDEVIKDKKATRVRIASVIAEEEEMDVETVGDEDGPWLRK